MDIFGGTAVAGLLYHFIQLARALAALGYLLNQD